MKYCVNCKHCCVAPEAAGYVCNNTNLVTTSPVTGLRIRISCELLRGTANMCKDGVYFEPKYPDHPTQGRDK